MSIVLIVAAALGDAAVDLGLVDPIPATPVLLAVGWVLALVGAIASSMKSPRAWMADNPSTGRTITSL